MPKSEPQRVCVEGEAHVFPGDLEKVMRLAPYFHLETTFLDDNTVALVKVNGRKS